MSIVKQLWKRYVSNRPEQYQAYVAFPPRTDQPSIGDVHDRIEELERCFEGRLDVYAKSNGIAVATDRVPAERFDVDAFESVLKRIEDVYAATHRLAQVEKCRPIDGRLVTSYVVVPVRPLFPRDATARSNRPTERVSTPLE
ncbi:hypothetical protein [Halostagnicola sp. A-GB9-2]|uniref:hypothetical protein n=1 Tax=Halostagnicola sp. A-GB9-2 TaxID=3048066 RepID=UPI0024BFAB7B|nr:hypothetical protein [Halostagnicola sp. A-GB9-2]MDJ1432737.1 hypothetical protein [Halostagnicola sp. A-GB9-2]